MAFNEAVWGWGNVGVGECGGGGIWGWGNVRSSQTDTF